MPRSTRLVALGAAAVLASCTERTGPSPDPVSVQPAESRLAGTATPAIVNSARERLARRLAVALADPAFRARVRRELERSPVREHKLHLQRFLTGTNLHALRDVARLSREPEATVAADARTAAALEFYMPVPEHRRTWKGDANLLVATAHRDREAPVAFTTTGKRLVLDANRPPSTPVLAVVPVETDFDRAVAAPRLQGGNTGGGSSNPPPGLYMTFSHFTEKYEGWLKGGPEFEVHLLGQAGASDSLTSYSCAGEHAGGWYAFDQNDLNWSGSVLLMSQTQINNYKSVHPNQNLRIFVVEDDDTSCQIKTDVNRFGALVRAVEAAYPQLTGGRDSTGTSLQRWWRRANALQKIIKAAASLIQTNDELVGNAVESAVVGVSYPGANWVVKGENNKTTGWINLVMR
jgi:hypothetical protein